MNDFKNDFVSYELALALSELGFDEPCLAVYRDLPDIIDIELGIDDTNFEITTWFNKIENKSQYVLNTPTYRQAFKFFRDKYKLYGFAYQYINHDNVYDSEPFFYNGKFIYGIERMAKNNTTISENDVLGFDFKSEQYDSYEEAELACLRKLIEICKKTEITTNYEIQS